MSTLTAASNQWMNRPADERFTSLTALAGFKRAQRERSRPVTVSNRNLAIEPTGPRSLVVTGPNGHGYEPTHHAFGQLAHLAGAPPSYLRTLPAPIAADALNYGLRFRREVEEVGCLIEKAVGARESGDEDISTFRAATGPKYGRIWDVELADELVTRFGDGVTGDWRVPGEFGTALREVTKENTTIFGGDRDTFVFLADEERRIELPNRRANEPGSFARGFFVWNSEVGSRSLGAAFFLFDYVCCNRIVWGAREYQEVRVRHSSGAPDRWLEEVAPVLKDYSEGSARPVLEAIEAARQKRVDDDLDAFLATRFGKGLVDKIKGAHEIDEGRPIETAWDVVTAATAHARSIVNQDDRVSLERTAGALLG